MGRPLFLRHGSSRARARLAPLGVELPFLQLDDSFVTPVSALHIDPPPEWIRAVYAEVGQAVPGVSIEWAVDEDRIYAAAGHADVIITGQRPVSAEIIDLARGQCRLIQVVGRAPWAVDLDAAAASAISVSVLPHTGAIAVAEHTMALMLSVIRRVVPGHLGTVGSAYVERGLTPSRTTERDFAYNWLGLGGVRSLHGLTLGLVGLGDIGLEVARRAAAFDMEVVYWRRSRLTEAQERLAEAVYLPLDDLLARSDVVSLHVPHDEVTEGMIDRFAMERMKPGAVLINTARGGLVDEVALATALQGGTLAGAGLDVFVEEPLPRDHPLQRLDNVVLSPHVGGAGGPGQKGIATAILENCRRVGAGETPTGLVL